MEGVVRPLPARVVFLLLSLPKFAVSSEDAPAPPSAAPSAPPPAPDADALQWWQTQRPTGNETSCLLPQPFGCHVITDELKCIGSRDGREKEEWRGLKIHGEPCVWCGGQPCRSGSLNTCEPLDFLMSGEGVGFTTFLAKLDYQAARCKHGMPMPPRGLPTAPPLATAAPIAFDVDDKSTAATPPPDVLFQIHVPKGMLGMPLAELPTTEAPVVVPTVPPLPTLPGTSGTTRQPSGGELPFNLTTHPTEAELFCLTHLEGDCSSVSDEEHCLQSRSAGSPCVWCGGAACRSGSAALCEALGTLVQGGGAGLASSTYQVATCSVNATSGENGTTGENGTAGQNETGDNPFGLNTPLFPWWAWLLVLVALCGAGVFVSLRSKERKHSKKKKKKTRGGDVFEEDSVATDSMLSVESPLVQREEEPSLFDLIDRDHDGVITQEEFAQAMGAPAPPPAASTMVPNVAPRGTVFQPMATTSVAIPGMAAPAGTALVMPQGRNVQLMQPAVPMVQMAVPRR